MRGIKFVFVAAAAIAGLTLSTGVGASTGKGSAPVKGSGAHIQNVIVNGSVQTHGQIPARVTRLLKTAADIPGRSCPGADSASLTPPNDLAVQTCVWTNASSPVTCIQISNSPNAVQTCDVTQTNATAANKALIIQIIFSNKSAATCTPTGPSHCQDGTQHAYVKQTNQTGLNTVGVAQYIKQSLGPGTPEDTEENELEPNTSNASSAPIWQSQESHQIVSVDQDTNALDPTKAGDNFSTVLQFLRQRERASNAPSITQHQNLQDREDCPAQDDINANMCAVVIQSSTNGKNSSKLNENYYEFQRARNTPSGEQRQGNLDRFIGGLNHEIHQSDSVLPESARPAGFIRTDQDERQVQRAVGAAVSQTQNGPRKGEGSSQFTGPGSQWTGHMDSTQLATSRATPAQIGLAPTSAAIQQNFLAYFGVSPQGDIRATLRATQNGQTTPASCPPTTTTAANHTCAAMIVCNNAPPPPLGFLRVTAGNCMASNPEELPEMPPCPGEQFRDPLTGRCGPFSEG